MFSGWTKLSDECWEMCGKKGGKCGACGENAYCCRNYDGNNGDCPLGAKLAASSDGHNCVELIRTGLYLMFNN